MIKTSKADFDFIIEDGFLIITDLNYGNRSVTNDIENVLFDIRQTGIDLSKYKIIYQDSTALFDGIIINPITNEFAGWLPMRESDIRKIKKL